MILEQIDKDLLKMAEESDVVLKDIYKKIDDVCLYNSDRILAAFIENHVSYSDFADINGYGNYDEGRDKIERIFATVLGCEDALVRPQIMSGTNALYLTLSALLKHGDTMISISGAPYDSLQEMIGLCGDSTQSLKANGVKYEQIDLVNDDFDDDKIIERLKENVDTLIVIPNDRLLDIVDRRSSIPDALLKADEVLQQAVQGITDLINLPALINLDFADVQTVMTDKGIAHIGIGEARGDDKAMEAVQQAVSSPLLETTIKGATHVIINISGDISLMDANDAASYVQELTGEDANIIFGAMYDDSVADYARITVIATGLSDNAQASNPFGNKASNSVFANKRPASTTASAGVNLNMPSFSMPTMNATPFTAKTPSSTVQKKDIQIPDFLRNR